MSQKETMSKINSLRLRQLGGIMEHQLNKDELRSNKLRREEFKKLPRKEIYILLDDFKVHHNIGTVIRLADAIMAKKVYLCGKTRQLPNRKIKDSSRGSERWVDCEYVENAVSLVKELKKSGVEIISLEITTNSIEYTEYIPKGPVCLILGREYDGVNKELINLSDRCIHLPIYGMCNSINVSNAAAVAMYHIQKYL